MSAAIYHEPYKMPAGMLTLAVHGAFFALLFLGFTWQATPPAMMSVELWQSLPEEAVALPVIPKVEEIVQPSPPPQAEKVIAPDIALPDKKKVESTPVVPKPDRKKPARKPAEAKRVDAIKPKPAEPKIIGQATDGSMAIQQAAQEQAAREQAEKEAAIGKVVDEFKAKIMAKIRRNIVMPANVADDARAEFGVTLLPGGAVLEARLLKTSGNAAYDSAVERAILKSDPLPLPPDVAMFNKFRELKLVFKPTEQQ